MKIESNGQIYDVWFVKKIRLKGKPINQYEVSVLKDDDCLWRLGLFHGNDENMALQNALQKDEI